MNDIPVLSDDEKRAILSASSEAYEKLRWQVGDSDDMRRELVLLARDSYCAGEMDDQYSDSEAYDALRACRDRIKGGSQ